jgi:Abortive infection alpha
VWARATAGPQGGEGRPSALPAASPPDRIRREMANLLDTSTDETRAREHLYATVLAQLAPDEARILSVLADGTPFPVLDLTARSAFGRSGRVLLRGASTVGKAAGVALPGHVPAYVTRLHALGLVEISDEDRSLDTQYDVLGTDETVVEAAGRASRTGFTRRTLRITDLGADLWRACAPDRDVPPAPSEREGSGPRPS